MTNENPNAPRRPCAPRLATWKTNNGNTFRPLDEGTTRGDSAHVRIYRFPNFDGTVSDIVGYVAA
jgi:hypothetical protein